MAKQSETVAHSEIVGGSQTSLHSHAGGSGGDYSLFRYRKGSRYHTTSGWGAATTLSNTANRLYAIPFLTPTDRTVTRMAIHVTTLGTGAAARLGIYADNGSLYPGALVLDAGTVDCSTTGLKEITGLSTNLTANTLYWLSSVCSVAFSGAAITAGYGWNILGWSTALNVVGNGYYYVSYTYAALPSSYPGGATETNAAVPKIAVYL